MEQNLSGTKVSFSVKLYDFVKRKKNVKSFLFFLCKVDRNSKRGIIYELVAKYEVFDKSKVKKERDQLWIQVLFGKKIQRIFREINDFIKFPLFNFSDYNEKTGDNLDMKQIKKMWHNMKRPIKSDSIGQIPLPLSNPNPIEHISIAAPSVAITRMN